MDSKRLNDFALQETFFIRLNFKRGTTIPSPVEIPISAQVKVVDKDFPKIQINLQVSSLDPQPVNLDIEMVAVFNYVGGDLDRGRNLLPVFLRDKGLHMMWPAIAIMMRNITSQMGMPPLNIKTPLKFDIPTKRDDILIGENPSQGVEAKE
jgi:hypothetical protein